MAFLRDMSNRVWGFISPRKTQQRREKPFKAPAKPIKRDKTPVQKVGSLKETKEISPQTRVQQWIGTPTSDGSMDQAHLPPSPPRSIERHYYDLDNETLIEDITEMNPEGEPTWNANEDTIIADDGEYMEQKKNAVDREVEVARRREQARNLRSAGWAEDTVLLFQKLGNRGYEALMPAEWINDFDMLPEFLFTTDEKMIYIKGTDGSDFHAQKALSELFNVGPRARDAVLTKAPVRTAEKQIRQAIHTYNRWAMKEDGGFATLWDGLSLFQVYTCAKNSSSTDLEKKATRRLDKLASRWRQAFCDRVAQNSRREQCKPDYDCIPNIPTLYGVLASHTVMAFVSYDVQASSPCLRTIAMFDFGQEDYDCWNAFAIAIFVIHCRNRMIELEEYLPYSESTQTKDNDPDI